MFKNIKIGPSDLCLVEHIVQSKSLGRLRPVVGMLCSQSLNTDVFKKKWGADYSGTIEWTQCHSTSHSFCTIKWSDQEGAWQLGYKPPFCSNVHYSDTVKAPDRTHFWASPQGLVQCSFVRLWPHHNALGVWGSECLVQAWSIKF